MRDNYSRAQIELLEVRVRALEIELRRVQKRLDYPPLEAYSGRVLEASV